MNKNGKENTLFTYVIPLNIQPSYMFYIGNSWYWYIKFYHIGCTVSMTNNSFNTDVI